MSNRDLRKCQKIVVLTGAGISAESGLATFRDSDGLWEKHDPMTIATPEAFARDPALVYRFYNARRAQLRDVEPNAAHRALAQLQRDANKSVFLITQNVDDLHERGGSEQVCHMHGELNNMLCTACGSRVPAIDNYDGSSRCPACNTEGQLRPDVVWFGEIPYHMALIDEQLRQCDVFIAVGTSGVVYPAAGFVADARSYGAMTLEVNKEVSEVSGLFDRQMQGVATEQVPRLVSELAAQPPGR